MFRSGEPPILRGLSFFRTCGDGRDASGDGVSLRFRSDRPVSSAKAGRSECGPFRSRSFRRLRFVKAATVENTRPRGGWDREEPGKRLSLHGTDSVRERQTVMAFAGGPAACSRWAVCGGRPQDATVRLSVRRSMATAGRLAVCTLRLPRRETKENENGTRRKAGTESRVSKLRHAADGREIVRNERRRQSESGLLRVLLPERRLRTVVYDGRDDRALRRHAGASERGFGDEHYARRIRRLHAGSLPEAEALEAGVRPVTGRHVPATGRRSWGKGGCGPVSGTGGPGEGPAVANRIGAGTGRIFSAASVGGQTVCRPSVGPVRKTKKAGTAASLRSGLRCGLRPGGPPSAGMFRREPWTCERNRIGPL